MSTTVWLLAHFFSNSKKSFFNSVSTYFLMLINEILWTKFEIMSTMSNSVHRLATISVEWNSLVYSGVTKNCLHVYLRHYWFEMIWERSKQLRNQLSKQVLDSSDDFILRLLFWAKMTREFWLLLVLSAFAAHFLFKNLA